MANKDKVILPEKYYLDNFKYVLDFVFAKYEPLLSDLEIQFITDFLRLSEEAQCLYVRISNRKGQFFRKEKLIYSEIPDIEVANKELMSVGFTVKKDFLEIDECYQLLSVYNKPEIIRMLKSISEKVDSTLKKEELLLALIERFDSQVLASVFYDNSVITQDGKEQLDMIKLFFFGHNHGDMSDFVVRDVGHVKYMELDESQLGSSFDSREEAEAVMQLSHLNKAYYLLEETVPALTIYEWFNEIEISYFLSLDKARRRAEKLIHKVGYHLEKNKLHPEALDVYELSHSSPMRERRIRIYNKEKDYEQSLKIATQIIQKPNDNKEYYIALDVINKLDKKLKTTTIRQKEGTKIKVDASFMYKVEEGALSYFNTLGFHGYHSENSICRNIFGLFFWEEIFDPQYNSMHQPLQRTPSDIYGKDFYQKRKAAINHKLDTTRTKKRLESILVKSIKAFEGMANPFVHWDEQMIEAMWKFLSFIKLKQVKLLLSEMSIDPKNRSTGFPDLFIWKENEYSFFEVKSPNDHLSEKQLFWLESFESWGIKAEIALVEWD